MDYLELLNKYRDEKYYEFHKTLVNSKYPIVGVRVFDIRKTAKEILKEDGLASIDNFKDRTYEEVLLKGFVIAYLKVDYNKKVSLIKSYVNLIDNWAICDSFVSALKNLDFDNYYKEVKKYLNSNDEYKLRFGIVMLISKYVNDKYADDIYNYLLDYKSDKYYYLMAKAWLLSVMFVFDFEKTLTFVKNNSLDDFTYHKGLTKAIESFRINDNQKEILKKIRSSK